MIILRLTALALATFLAGCAGWQGPAFYAAMDNVPIAKPGLYHFDISGGESGRWDGSRIVDNPSSNDGLLFVAAPGLPADVFLVQYGSLGGPATYAFIDRQGENFLLDLPDCRGTRKIARRAGAEIAPATMLGRKALLCSFPTRAALEQAAREYIQKRGPSPRVKIERIGD